MIQTDTIQATTAAGAEQIVHKHYQLTPAQVLSWYPKTYTESQKDSVIQKYIKPNPIRWSQRPDTLHLPGHTVGKSVLDASLPQYYKESFFSTKPYFHPEIMGGRQGVPGDPVPYTVASDNFMTSLLLICFVVTIFALRGARGFIIRKLKSFSYYGRGLSDDLTETSTEVRFQLILMAESCLMASLFYFSYLTDLVTETFTIGQSQIITLFTGVFALSLLAKITLYDIVNSIFFDKKKNKHWTRSFAFLTALFGLSMIPLVFIQAFFNLTFDSTAVYILFLLIFYELLLFWRQNQIFFAQNGRFLQNILYFCMLEIIPGAILWYVLTVISEYLKINF